MKNKQFNVYTRQGWWYKMIHDTSTTLLSRQFWVATILDYVERPTQLLYNTVFLLGDNYVTSLDLEWVVTLLCLLLWWGRWWRTPCSPPCWWGWSWSRCEVERMLVACLGRRANTAPWESCSCERKESSWIALKMCFLNWVWSINKIILFLLHIFRASNIVWFFHSLSIFQQLWYAQRGRHHRVPYHH